MVKQVKHSLKCLHRKMLSLMEFCCMLQESPVANIPLGLWQYIMDVFSTWWKKLEIYGLPTLFPNNTWKTPQPNIKARDVCLLHESLDNHSVASYKYCKVI